MALQMSSVHTIGIICEDETDFQSLKILISRIVNKTNLSYKKRIGEGCSKIKSKGLKWSDELYKQGCDLLVVVHDRDREDYESLSRLLQSKFSTSLFTNRYVCIPVEEIEAWFLADPQGISNLFKLDRQPKISSIPENINAPKEYLRDQVSQCSNGRKSYLNTIHNAKLSEVVAIDQIKTKSKSFEQLHNFLVAQSYH